MTVPVNQAGTQVNDAARYRWLVLAVFVLSTAINYLDRATLSALAPVLTNEFHLSNAQYGLIGSAFSLGSVVAPRLATWIALRSGWRHAFVVAGVLGLAWIPLWIWVSRRAQAAPAPGQNRMADAAILRGRALCGVRHVRSWRRDGLCSQEEHRAPEPPSELNNQSKMRLWRN